MIVTHNCLLLILLLTLLGNSFDYTILWQRNDQFFLKRQMHFGERNHHHFDGYKVI